MGKRLDVTGQRFGSLVAIKPTDIRKRNSVNWLFKCDCGKEVILPVNSVRAGRNKSCGCHINRAKATPRKQRDLTGQIFGQLTVIRPLGHIDEEHHYSSLVKCSCGAELVVRDTLLIKGRKTCCKECSVIATLKHGLTDTKLFNTWQSMRGRCYNKNDTEYKYYGARGICICPEWKDDFMSFYLWSIENGYKEGLSIDRINVNGNYASNNCRWATVLQQARNKTNTRYIHFEGKYMPVRDVADITGIKAGTILQRLDKRGWDEYSASHLPPNSRPAYNPTMRKVVIQNINTGEKLIFQNSAEASRYLQRRDSFIIGKIAKSGTKFVYKNYLVEIFESEKVQSEKQTYKSLRDIS